MLLIGLALAAVLCTELPVPCKRIRPSNCPSSGAVSLPVGLNWGLFNVLQALFAGCTLVLQDIFNADETLRLIEAEKVTHFCAAPAHLVSILNAPGLEAHDLTLQIAVARVER